MKTQIYHTNAAISLYVCYEHFSYGILFSEVNDSAENGILNEDIQQKIKHWGISKNLCGGFLCIYQSN